MKDPVKVNPNSVSLAGEFAVLSQLALRGFDANMTLGRTKNVDILVSDPKKGKMYKLEVKTTLRDFREKPYESKIFGKYSSYWMMDVKHETISEDNLFYCFVAIGKPSNTFRFFIVPSNVVSLYVKSEHAYWLKEAKGKDQNMRQFRLGLKGVDYGIKTPIAEDYEDNWDFHN